MLKVERVVAVLVDFTGNRKEEEAIAFQCLPQALNKGLWLAQMFERFEAADDVPWTFAGPGAFF